MTRVKVVRATPIPRGGTRGTVAPVERIGTERPFLSELMLMPGDFGEFNEKGYITKKYDRESSTGYRKKG